MKRYFKYLSQVYRVPLIADIATSVLITLTIVAYVLSIWSLNVGWIVLTVVASFGVVAPVGAFIQQRKFSEGEMKVWLYPDEYDSRRY